MDEPVILNNRYRLEERLGSGGMAMVYRARDLTLERDVAIKLLRENFSKDPAFQDRFRQEAKAAANLSHQNIVTVHDFGYDSGRLFIVMEYVPGTDLKTILQRRGRYPIRDAINLTIQACAGVGYAHRAGLVHCDIKSQNFIITPDNRLKVTDFGIARALASIQPDEKSDVVWGSPQYFSPEQASGSPPSPASDVYSLGVVMYEMLTGKLPFTANTAEELARMHREDPPPPPSRFNPALPTMLEQILFKVLSKEPSNRYRTADQLGRVLVTYLKQTTQTETFASPIKVEEPPAKREIQTPPPPIAPPYAKPYRQSQPVFTSPQSASQATYPFAKSESGPLDIDWVTILLGLATLVAVGGLIPLWIWVYFLYQ
jgi:serine/threonine protein kinase